MQTGNGLQIIAVVGVVCFLGGAILSRVVFPKRIEPPKKLPPDYERVGNDIFTALKAVVKADPFKTLRVEMSNVSECCIMVFRAINDRSFVQAVPVLKITTAPYRLLTIHLYYFDRFPYKDDKPAREVPADEGSVKFFIEDMVRQLESMIPTASIK